MRSAIKVFDVFFACDIMHSIGEDTKAQQVRSIGEEVCSKHGKEHLGRIADLVQALSSRGRVCERDEVRRYWEGLPNGGHRDLPEQLLNSEKHSVDPAKQKTASKPPQSQKGTTANHPQSTRPRDENVHTDDSLMRLSCPHCGKKMKVLRSHAGKSISCIACHKVLTVPNELDARPVQQASQPVSPPSEVQGRDSRPHSAPRSIASRAEPSRRQFKRTRSPGESVQVFSNLTQQDSQGVLEAQLWLFCQKPSMAEALLSKRPESTDQFVTGTLELVEFSNGRAAAVFHLKSGQSALPFIRALFTGKYGDEHVVINNGCLACVPQDDVRQIMAMFGSKAGMSVGRVCAW